jgi:hypothetical protein
MSSYWNPDTGVGLDYVNNHNGGFGQVNVTAECALSECLKLRVQSTTIRCLPVNEPRTPIKAVVGLR